MSKDTLTLGSLFSGSGGFELAGLLAGIKPIWNCEVEPFPIMVTTKRLPGVKHYGDISALNGAELEPVDIITGGFPCQSVSVAGKRAGVKHVEHGGDETTRSGLFYEATRIIKEMRKATNGKYPKYFVVENVPGLFSSNKGEDFRQVLEEIIGIVEPEAKMPAPDQNRYTESPWFGMYITIARWCNQPGFFKKKTLREFALANGENSSAMRYLAAFEQAVPEAACYMDMKFGQ